MKKYIHTTNVHNLNVPKEIVQEILKHFTPKLVIDIWCGTGSFVKTFQNNGIIAVGVDWKRVDRKSLFIDESDFIEKDLEEYNNFDHKYDLAISLEVAEHISEKSAENFVKTLVSCSDYIIFSAAIPLQWGQNHINEQSPEYWEKLFNKYWYEFHDVWRHIFWDNKDIFWWYKQNMFLIVRKWVSLPRTLIEKPPRYIVHPELYHQKMAYLKNPLSIFKYWGWILYKNIRKILWI